MKLAIISTKRWTYELDAAEKAAEKAAIDRLTDQVLVRSTEHILPDVTGVPAPTRAEVRRVVAREYRKTMRANLQVMVDNEISRITSKELV